MRSRTFIRLDRVLSKVRAGKHKRPRGQDAKVHPPLVAGNQRPLSRLIVEQLFSRVAGAAPVGGNALRLLQDGEQNYGAWLAAIAAAQHHVYFENYIFRADPVGHRFADALVAKAQEGVRVRVLYDWMGCLGQVPRGFWRRLRDAGAEVRCFNPPRLDSPFGWLSRNHRKTVCVDGEVGFVAGLCVGQVWVGDPSRSLPAWRDTGVEMRGPAVADLEAAFAQSWAGAGGTSPERDPSHDPGPGDVVPPSPAGSVTLRVIGSRPNTMGLYRFDQLIAGMARRSLWLTDAYFVGTTSYVRALCDAAADGVDVRLLVPGASDIPVAKAMSRAGYRALLEAGIRVYEWNGPMLHAKTAVADGRWARIGSSNLNIASWMGNWELDVAVEDEGFAAEMERMFERDLQGATEIVLDLGRVHSTRHRTGPARRGSPGRLAAGAVGLGSAVGAAITNHRALGPAEAKVMAFGGGILLALAAVAIAAPRLLTVPLALLAVWIGVTLLVRAWRLRLSRAVPPPDPLPTGNPHAAPANPHAPGITLDDAPGALGDHSPASRSHGEDRKLEPAAPDRRQP
jgi:cardiolipin synthase